METILLAVTGVSLLVALIMSVAAWRMAREERTRSAARVAALAAAASEPERAFDEPWNRVIPDQTHLADPTARALERPWTEARVPTSAPRPSVAQRPAAVLAATRVPELILNERTETAPMADMFLGGAQQPVSGGRQRGLAAAAAVLFVLLGGGAYWALSDRPAAASHVGSQVSPLELISLRHERQGGHLTVSGLVRNPAASEAIDGLTAVVFLFDQNGGFITSAKAGVDFKRLSPGDESPFVINFDVPSSVARYRVSFRTTVGVVPHVDRRGQDPVATTAVAR